jgi:hypothetical protein
LLQLLAFCHPSSENSLHVGISAFLSGLRLLDCKPLRSGQQKLNIQLSGGQ